MRDDHHQHGQVRSKVNQHVLIERTIQHHQDILHIFMNDVKNKLCQYLDKQSKELEQFRPSSEEDSIVCCPTKESDTDNESSNKLTCGAVNMSWITSR